MINLMRGELYKLFKSKCFYVCSIVLVSFVLLMYGMFSLVDMVDKEEAAMAGNVGITVSVETNMPEELPIWEQMGVIDLVQMMFSSMGSLLIAIFASVFVCSEYTCGAIKNIVGKGYGRGTVFLSKYFSSIVGAILIELLMLGTILMCELLILHGNRLSGEFFAALAEYVAIQLMLAAAQTGVIVMLNQFLRSLGAGIAVSVCLIMFYPIVTAVINALLQYLKVTINVNKYWVVDMISECPATDITGKIWGHNVLWSMVWIVLTIAVGILHYRKADVK